MDIVQIILIAIALIIIAKGLIQNLSNKESNKIRKAKKKKKYRNPKNNYFRNNPEHVDMTDNYINIVWEEIKKK